MEHICPQSLHGQGGGKHYQFGFQLCDAIFYRGDCQVLYGGGKAGTKRRRSFCGKKPGFRPAGGTACRQPGEL